ncbi:hypothetical protein EUGRSUZ_H02114 [Eucalyptus grandis]|uniref:Uncharacterized protein n=2 Tax=Eucalyptus grandis TaxID=71139 RepID=A0ACC3JS54_EUCGR|nr:hypothetical protein EUGRSUZ_H02114 [Eucalyptus grandis]
MESFIASKFASILLMQLESDTTRRSKRLRLNRLSRKRRRSKDAVFKMLIVRLSICFFSIPYYKKYFLFGSNLMFLGVNVVSLTILSASFDVRAHNGKFLIWWNSYVATKVLS